MRTLKPEKQEFERQKQDINKALEMFVEVPKIVENFKVVF